MVGLVGPRLVGESLWRERELTRLTRTAMYMYLVDKSRLHLAYGGCLARDLTVFQSPLSKSKRTSR